MSGNEPRRRRWFRFGLRGLLLLVTVIGIAVGWTISRIRHQQQVLAELKSIDATIHFAHQIEDEDNPAPGPSWLKRLFGDDFWVVVNGIAIHDSRLSDEMVEKIATLPRVEYLDLESDSITDDGMASLARCSNVSDLTLTITSDQVTREGIQQLKGLKKLEQLNLRGQYVDDRWLPVVAEFTPLRSLGLLQTSITDAGLQHLKSATKGLRELDYLRLSGTNVDDNCLAVVAELTSLRRLVLSRTAITDDGLRPLESAVWLEHIFLSDTKATKMGVERLRKALPNCFVDGP